MNKTEPYGSKVGDILWIVNEEDNSTLERTLLSRLESLLTDATLVKQNMYRSVYFLRLNEGGSTAGCLANNTASGSSITPSGGSTGCKGIFVKRYKTGDWKSRLSSLGSGLINILGVALPLLTTQAQREWRMMLEMKKKGLPVPLPLALGQKSEGSELIEYLVTQEITDSRPIRDCYRGDKETLLKALAILTTKLHKSNIFFKDFQLGNILCQQRPFVANGTATNLRVQNLKPELYLLDLHSARPVTSLKMRQKIWMLAKLLSSFEPFGNDPASGVVPKSPFDAKDWDRFLELYARGMPDFRNGFRPNVEKVKALADKIRRIHLKSRTQRCTKNSTSFTLEVHDGWKVYRRRDFTTEEIFKLLRAYEGGKATPNSGEVTPNGDETTPIGGYKGIKSTRKTHLKILQSEKGNICIKHYFCDGTLDYLKGLVGLSRARRAWVMGNGLVARGFPTAQPFALVEDQEEAFLLSRALTDFPRLDYYILENFKGVLNFITVQKKKDLIIALARTVRLFHDKRVYHGDLKACNILVEEVPQSGSIAGGGSTADIGDWKFYLIDYDRVIFDKEISLRRRAKNLAQLHTSIPWCISRSDRMRFYREYSKGLALDKKSFLRTVLQFSADRIPVLMEPIE